MVGDDVFAVLERRARRRRREHWFGYLGYACRPDLPARPGRRDARRGVDAGAARRVLRTHLAGSPAEQPARRRRSDGHWCRDEYAAAFARVQEQLHAGNSYEVNLTYRVAADCELDPATAYLRLRELNPAPYAGFLQHDVPGARAWLLSSTPERYAT